MFSHLRLRHKPQLLNNLVASTGILNQRCYILLLHGMNIIGMVGNCTRVDHNHHLSE